MDGNKILAQEFEAQRPQLRAVAFRMLGSLAEADDAVQEAWLRLQSSPSGKIENSAAWLTTVVARICLDMLRTRKSRREEPLETDGRILPRAKDDPEQETLLAEAVGLALLVVLTRLDPAERIAFVLHDMFALPFEDIAPIVDRSVDAARQLASRARRRVQGAEPAADADAGGRRAVVDAFLAAARGGDLAGLVAVLDPDVVLRADGGTTGLSRVARGAETVARGAIMFRRMGLTMRRALINGTPGTVSFRDGKPFSVGAFTVRGGRVAALDILADPDRLAQLDLAVLED